MSPGDYEGPGSERFESKARTAKSAVRPAPGMSVLRPQDQLPDLNTATVLVGISSPASPPAFPPWLCLSRLVPCTLWGAGALCSGRGVVGGTATF